MSAVAPEPSPALPPGDPRRTWAIAAAAVAVFLILGLGLFASTGHDDSHITYWVAHALQRFGRLVNYNGERVEQSSSLTHVVLLALLGLVTRLPMPTLGPLTSIAGGALTIVLSGRLVRRLAPATPPLAELCVATSATFVYWSFGGLETTLFAAAALWLILACDAYLTEPAGAIAWPVAALGLFVATRPEAPLVVAAVFAVVLVHALLRRRARAAGAPDPLRAALVLAGVAAACSALLFGFRRLYFGSFFPNPVYTKVTKLDVKTGLTYLWTYVWPSGVWLVAGLALALFFITRDALGAKGARPGAVLAAAFAVAYLGFVVLTGGDWMTGGRFIAHFVPVVTVLAVVGVARVIPRPRWAAAALGLGVLMNGWGTVSLADTGSTGRPLWTTGRLRAQLDARVGPRDFSFFELANRIHLRDATISAHLVDLVGAVHKAHPERRLTMMASQAGMVVYHAFAAHPGVLHFVDMCSLVTREFRVCLPPARLDLRQVGMQLPFDRYFRDREAIDRRCGTTRPDFVFGLGHRGIEPVLEKDGYTIVFRQRGSIPSGGSRGWFHGPVSSDEFIAVDTALLLGSGFEVKPPYVWDIR